MCGRDDLRHGALRQELAVDYVSDLVATLSLVYVMRGD